MNNLETKSTSRAPRSFMGSLAAVLVLAGCQPGTQSPPYYTVDYEARDWGAASVVVHLEDGSTRGPYRVNAHYRGPDGTQLAKPERFTETFDDLVVQVRWSPREITDPPQLHEIELIDITGVELDGEDVPYYEPR